jgi:hypothetical protein
MNVDVIDKNGRKKQHLTLILTLKNNYILLQTLCKPTLSSSKSWPGADIAFS